MSDQPGWAAAKPEGPRGARNRLEAGLTSRSAVCDVKGRRCDPSAVRRDLQRIDGLWSDALQASGGPFLFGEFSAADAYFAPVVARARCYALPLSALAQAYADQIWASRGVAAWVADALAEHDFLDFEEPYRSSAA